uniref:Secreted venom protein family 5 protein n=1 Tax=Pristhesancus plagipennis TaxID=1955184 RepID=A0A2K8JXC8_PRIPG|nr:secreted venom protein family 5 protein [Pristhesancus plagipennis]
MFKKIILTLVLVTTVRSDYTTVLNKLMDDVIELAKTDITDVVNLEHVTFPYTYKWLFISKTGTVDCHKGQVKSFKSLQRSDDTTLVVNDDNTLSLKVGVGLSQFDFAFDQCTVDWFMIPRGPLDGHIGTNSLDLEFTVDITKPKLDGNFSCVATINDISLQKYDDVQLKLSGKGVLHWIEEKILNLVATGNTARKMFNGVIENVLRKKMPKFELLITPILQLHSAKTIQSEKH